ncbi:MAG: hypothetical protein ACLUJU_01860 [Subdoligranulum sp.]
MQTIYDAKILIVDDNRDLLNLLPRRCAASAGLADRLHRPQRKRHCRRRTDDFDINLPDGDGFTLFRAAQHGGYQRFLSAPDAGADRLFGLGLGADDTTKPFLTQGFCCASSAFCSAAIGANCGGLPQTLQLSQRTVYLADALVRLPDAPPAPDGHRAHSAAKAGRKPRPYRYL